MCFPNVVAIFECNKILACVVSPKMRKDEQKMRERVERERIGMGEEEKGNIGVELKNKKKMV